MIRSFGIRGRVAFAAACIGSLGLFGFGATVAQAQTADISQTVYAVGDLPNPLPSNGSAAGQIALSPIRVLASVGGRCGFVSGSAPNGAVNQPNFDVTGFDQTFTFVLNCTGPSRVGVVSTNGGMKQATASLPSGYANFAPYDVGLTLNGNAGATISASCDANSLIASATGCTTAYGGTGGTQTNFTGPASTTKGLRLASPSTTGVNSSIRVRAAQYAGASVLVDGTYGDTLTITLSAAP